MKPLDVDPELLRQTGGELDSAAERMDALLQQVSGQLATVGEVWGGDDLGFLIGECFGGAFELAVDCFEANTDALEEYADRLRGMAEAYERVEETNTQSLLDLERALDSGTGRA
ncbi:WXG100 family type VII secretion target [Micromonospora orduensis]|uniref:WXG100 family type VII secretion target n=1 Tax=Micromonospora orduensis TaxID=1420891 RepID=UPI0036453548